MPTLGLLESQCRGAGENAAGERISSVSDPVHITLQSEPGMHNYATPPKGIIFQNFLKAQLHR